ncbi:hypothetical protein MPSEU_000124100 [Mayamaea pseudoterrestris]|nr:hypothetical protein MPSEU_000124100 [Mayamaea pseudoterrestris]
MIQILSLLLAAFACVHSVSAAKPANLWALNVLGRNDVNGACLAQADAIGQQVQDVFNAAVPGFTTYYPDDNAGRFLRSVHRELTTINVCDRTYCSKPRNWDVCIFSGCSCTCGRGRELVSENASDQAKILEAKRILDAMLVTKGVELGCELGLVLKKVT